MKNVNEHFFHVFISNLCIFFVKCLSNLLPIGKLIGCKSSLYSLDSSSLPNIIFKYLHVASSVGTWGHWECVVIFWFCVFWLIFVFYHMHSENFVVLISGSMIHLEEFCWRFHFYHQLTWYDISYYSLITFCGQSLNLHSIL